MSLFYCNPPGGQAGRAIFTIPYESVGSLLDSTELFTFGQISLLAILQHFLGLHLTYFQSSFL